MSVLVGVSSFWCTGLVFIQPYYCDVLLLKQLLPEVCQAAGDFNFPVHHACARALSCCNTRLRTHNNNDDKIYRVPLCARCVASEQARPECCRLEDMNSSFRNAFIRNSNGHQTLNIYECLFNELWLLTKWCIIFHKVGQKHPSGEVGSFCCKLTSVSVCQKLLLYSAVWQSYLQK